MVQHAHRARAPARHRGDLVDVETGQVAQQDDLALVDRQGAKPGDRRLEGLFALGLTARSRVTQLGQLSHGQRLACGTTVVVEGASPRPREEPPAERRLVPAEAMEPVGGLDPDVRGNILARVAAHHPQIAKQRRVQRTPERRDRPLLTVLRGGQHLRESLDAPHQADIGIPPGERKPVGWPRSDKIRG